eukprot:UN27525
MHALEGYLRRLNNNSKYHRLFVLTGGMLARQHIHPRKRWTQDLDFMCFCDFYGPKDITEIIISIAHTSINMNDGVIFSNHEISTEVMHNSAIRVMMVAQVFRVQVNIQIDLIFCTPIYPPATNHPYETLHGDII